MTPPPVIECAVRRARQTWATRQALVAAADELAAEPDRGRLADEIPARFGLPAETIARWRRNLNRMPEARRRLLFSSAAIESVELPREFWESAQARKRVLLAGGGVPRSTLNRWRLLYRRHGLAGLGDGRTLRRLT